MKHKLIIAGLAVLFSAFTVVVSAANPDFSGTWTLDAAKSEGLAPGMTQVMTVTQSGEKLSLETKVKTEQGEQTVPDSYTLDGKEAEYAPKAPNGASAKGKRAAKWTTDGLEVQESATFDTPDGAVTVKTTRKWTLSADGKTLKIDITQELPNGTKQTKRTFNKK